MQDITNRRITYSRGRARNVSLMLRAGSRGELEVTPELLNALARVADRIAFELAVVDRDLTMAGSAA